MPPRRRPSRIHPEQDVSSRSSSADAAILRLYRFQMQRPRKPRGDNSLNLRLAPVVEMVAAGNDFHVARTTGARAEILGGVVFARFLVATDVERRAFDRRRDRKS